MPVNSVYAFGFNQKQFLIGRIQSTFIMRSDENFGLDKYKKCKCICIYCLSIFLVALSIICKQYTTVCFIFNLLIMKYAKRAYKLTSLQALCQCKNRICVQSHELKIVELHYLNYAKLKSSNLANINEMEVFVQSLYQIYCCRL